MIRFIFLFWLLAACAPQAQKVVAQELKLSATRGNLQQLINDAIRSKRTVVIDRNIEIRQTIDVDGDLTLRGLPGVTITNMVQGKDKYMFMLGNGRHQFSNLTIAQHPDGAAFSTRPETGSLWTNVFDSVHITSGRGAYTSSRGGKPDQWCITTWKNSRIRVAAVGISIYSQDGPYKALHLEHIDIANGKAYGNHRIEGRDPEHISHNLYCHPNVSLDFNDVVLEAGSLAMHHFSGGGVPGQNQYVRLHRVICKKGAFEMVTPEKDPILITDSEIGPYTTLGVPHPRVDARNSRFKNMGNGIMLQGRLTNCRGGAWTSPFGPLEIVDSQLDEISFRMGGKAIVRNSTIAHIWAGERDNPFEADIYGSTIADLHVIKPTGRLRLDKASSVTKQSKEAASVLSKM